MRPFPNTLAVTLVAVAVATLAVVHAHTPETGPNPAAAMPLAYRTIVVPDTIWTDERLIARGRELYSDKCAVCHGSDGRGDGSAAAGLPLKPASFRDAPMMAEMSGRYLFWRVSEGGQVEPFRSAGSVMPPWKDDLPVVDRHAVIAYVHTLAQHHGPHTEHAHPRMLPDGPVAHPELIERPASWITRDHRRAPRGPWNWAVERRLPELFREFNGIDFGHAHLGETLLQTDDPARIERARLDIVDFIFGGPKVGPDEEQVAPTFARLAWELQRVFDWSHLFHKSLYDMFATDAVTDKAAAYRKLLAGYRDHPDAITSHALDHHRRLWSFPESRAFADRFPKFNTQIWAYHWLQAAAYDVQLEGDAATQRELFVTKVIPHYHGYLRTPPVEWTFMPMMAEAAPEFAKRFPEAAAIFDNLHMLHDNVDDILVRRDLYPTMAAKREAILRVMQIYLHRHHEGTDRFAFFHAEGGMHHMPGPRPPSVHEVLGAIAPKRGDTH